VTPHPAEQNNTSGWQLVGESGFSEGSAKFLSLSIYHGTPYIVYQDWANGLTATAMKFNGASWEYVGGKWFSTHAASSITYKFSFFISDSGIPYFAYTDADNGNKATVMRYIEQ